MTNADLLAIIDRSCRGIAKRQGKGLWLLHRWFDSIYPCQQKTHFCLSRQRCVFWMMFACGKWCWATPNDVRFANDAWLRHILWQTSHHCEWNEQHHICEANASYRRRRCIIWQAYRLLVFSTKSAAGGRNPPAAEEITSWWNLPCGRRRISLNAQKAYDLTHTPLSLHYANTENFCLPKVFFICRLGAAWAFYGGGLTVHWQIPCNAIW